MGSDQAFVADSFSSSSFNSNTFGQNHNPFSRTQSTPSKPPGSSFLQRTTTAPSFRNPAFTTPRKPFDADAFEASPAESSPAAATDVSMPDTPDHDQSIDSGHATVTPATMSRHRSLTGGKKTPGKGGIARTVFTGRDRIRKRRRHNGEQDISGFRLPYRQQAEWDETDYDSDESTGAKPHEARRSNKQRGWLSNFLTLVQRHPHAPQILGFWLSFAFNVVVMAGTLSFLWFIYAGLREDFHLARQDAKDEILKQMAECRQEYEENKCREQRLPAIKDFCEKMYNCWNQDPSSIRNVQIGAKGIVEILNEIVESMHWKTLLLVVFLGAVFISSGRSIVKSTAGYADFTSQPPPPPNPYPSHPAANHMMHSAGDVAWEHIPQQTPRHFKSRQFSVANDDTPETDDGSPPPPRFSRALMGPETPSRRSPIKGERERSPTKNRSPTKRYQ